MSELGKLSLTKIIATLGPASHQRETIMALIQAGVSVFRFNFSHGDADYFAELLATVRAVSEELGVHTGVIGDLPGPKIRVGEFEDAIPLETGTRVTLVSNQFSEPLSSLPGEPIISVNYEKLVEEVQQGHRILIDDGTIELACTEKRKKPFGEALICEVLRGGLLQERKGVNLPDTDLSIASPTQKDLDWTEFAVNQGIDFLAMSFVRAGKDLRQIKDHLRKLGARPVAPKQIKEGCPSLSSYGSGAKPFVPVIAKIETPQALDRLTDIINEADAVMVARGDLGVEMDPAQVPTLQKKIIGECHSLGRPAIVATQMLQSMVASPHPTRAEVSDVANAIYDGADAVMLSGETAVGKWPVETVRFMNRICEKTNQHLGTLQIPTASLLNPRASKYRTVALAHGVKIVMKDLDSRLVVMWSHLGGGASYLSQNRLRIPILAFSASYDALRRISIFYGVTPVFMERPSDTENFIIKVDKYLFSQR